MTPANLVRQMGPMLSSAELTRVFGYPSAKAYRMAVARQTVPVPLFRIPHRRGHFALTCDVAAWLFKQRQAATQRCKVPIGAGDAPTPDHSPLSRACPSET